MLRSMAACVMTKLVVHALRALGWLQQLAH